jgi:hypothetical protein
MHSRQRWYKCQVDVAAADRITQNRISTSSHRTELADVYWKHGAICTPLPTAAGGHPSLGSLTTVDCMARCTETTKGGSLFAKNFRHIHTVDSVRIWQHQCC